MNIDEFFFPLKEDIEAPNKFTYPFHYEPHELSIIASKEVQKYLTTAKLEHNFGLADGKELLTIGKMFGVLIVKNKSNKLGYLRAYSGDLLGNNSIKGFVPPVYDLDKRRSFYDSAKEKIEKLNVEIAALENHAERRKLLQAYLDEKNKRESLLNIEKEKIKAARTRRKEEKNAAILKLETDDYRELCNLHKEESLREKFFIKSYTEYSNLKLKYKKEASDIFETKYKDLLELRKTILSRLQTRQQEQYRFLNTDNETASISDIFYGNGINPPSGTGDCAAPKLLQFAFKHGLTPIAMAEFWWGASPKSVIRHHAHFYPSCKSRCLPILGHMLKGLEVDENPLLNNAGKDTKIKILFEDDHIIVIDKPSGLLSVPGKNFNDSVATRLKEMFPDSSGPLVTHRLDQCTSGILLAAKDEKTYKNLQQQFIKRTIKKQYIAVLERVITSKQGTIELPLRVDLDNRPYQMVCPQHGKRAVTKYKVLESDSKTSRVEFTPITGRTHQLRVHAAHSDGLNAPIIGDSLYGKKRDRLLLHASWIEFKHPVTSRTISFKCKAPF